MAVKNHYNTKEKEKSIYRSSSATNSSHTAAARTQSTPQSNVWNAEQSTPGPQSTTLQNRKHEKSPSELGEEVVMAMLDDDAVQRTAKANRSKQHDTV